MRHLLGYNFNQYTGFEDQFADVERPWNLAWFFFGFYNLWWSHLSRNKDDGFYPGGGGRFMKGFYEYDSVALMKHYYIVVPRPFNAWFLKQV